MIFVEGKPDKILLIALGFPQAVVKVAGSKGAVCNQLKKKSNVKGMVDEDPGTAPPKYLTKLFEVYKDKYIIELEDRTNSNKVIVVRPFLEEWILDFCLKFDIKLAKYFLPTTSGELKKVINYRLPKLQKLIEENLQIDSLQKLKSYVNK